MISNKKPVRLAVFASGNGSNFQAIYDYMQSHKVNGFISLVLSNCRDAYVLQRAKKAGIETCVLSVDDFEHRQAYDQRIAAIMEQKNIDLIVLAGYMLLLTPWFTNRFKERVINVHPSLLPSFKGTQGIKDAYDYGVKITGVTVHFVDSKLDHGPIILQKEVPIKASYSLEDLEEKIHTAEHRLYPKAVHYFCSRKLVVKGRKVMIRE